MACSKSMMISRFWAVALATFLHAPAWAQFTGDVFFLQPSIVVAPGGTGQLDLAFFSGAKPFGIARATVQFDSAKMEILAVEPVASGPVHLRLDWAVAGGTLTLLCVNGESLTNPIGTVQLARIRVRPLGAAGERVSLTSRVKQPHAADRSALPRGQGFGAEVSIGAVGTSAVMSRHRPSVAGGRGAADILAVQGQSELGQRVALLRPLGHAVEIFLPVPGAPASFSRVTVQSAEVRPGTPGESGDR